MRPPASVRRRSTTTCVNVLDPPSSTSQPLVGPCAVRAVVGNHAPTQSKARNRSFMSRHAMSTGQINSRHWQPKLTEAPRHRYRSSGQNPTVRLN
jgi:hypothetical protein